MTRTRFRVIPSEPATAAAAEGAEPPVTEVNAPPPGRSRRRWRKWVVLLLLLLAIRLALPAVVAPLLAVRLSRALGTRVEIGDLSFQPIDAILTLRNVTVHTPDGTEASAAPAIQARRIRVDLQWLPLLHRQLQIRELAVESGGIALDRFADGSFGLANLEQASPIAELPSGWSAGLDRITVYDSQLRVRDLAAEGADVLEAKIRTASVSGIRRRATAFGKSPNLHVDALVGNGQLRVRGHYELRDDGLVLSAQMRVKDVPLAQAKAYVADRGWTDLSGTVSGQLRWQREPRRRDLLTGRVELRRGRLQVAGLAEPALTVRRAIAEIGAIDLLTRRIVISSLTLRGATLALQPRADAPVPLLAKMQSRPPPRTRPHVSPRTSIDPPSRWHWMIEGFETVDGRMRVLSPEGCYDLRAQASGENLGPGAYWSPLRLHARWRHVVAAFDGTVRLGETPTIEGRLTAGGIDFPGLARTAALPWADLIQAGRATADLTVQVDTMTSDTFVRGGISLADVWIAGPDPGMFAFGSKAIELTLDRYELWTAPRNDGQAPGPPEVIFSSMQIDAPYVVLTRTVDGWALPPFTPPSVAVATADEAGGVPEPPPAPTPPVAKTTIQNIHADDGTVTVVDFVPATEVTWDIKRVAGSVRRLSLPGFSYDGLRLRGSDHRFGSLEFGGSRRGDTATFEAAGHGVPLAAATPYLRLAGLPYSFSSGKASFNAHGSITGAGWTAETTLTLQDASLLGSEALQMAIGMPVSSALAVLQDEAGAMSLHMTLAAASDSSRATLPDQIAAGIRNTIRGVSEAAATAARERARLPVVNVLFSPGQTMLTVPAMEEIAPLAELLGSRPGLVVELSAGTSARDRRWLAEQALLPRLEDGGGFRGVLRALGMQDARARIRTALAARARGAPGWLNADDEAFLTRMLAEAPPVAEQQIAGLREVRLTRVASYLSDRYDIAGRQVVIRRGIRDKADVGAVRAEVVIGADITGAMGPPKPTAPDGP